MAIPFHKAVSSLDSIQSTIENDSHTYRWFVKFISHPSIKERLGGIADARKNYDQLKSLELYKKVFYLISAGIIAVIFLTKNYFLAMLLLPVLAGMIKSSSTHKKLVAKISRSLLEIDREAIKLESQTLYQLCESYGTALKIPTLVDIIARQDDIMRKTAIYACVLTCFIYPFDFWNNWLIIAASFFLIQAAINTPLVFDHLK